MLESLIETVSAIATAFSLMATDISSITNSLGTILASFMGGMLSSSGMCSSIASVLPIPKKEKGIYKVIHHIINKLAFNFGQAANRIKPPEDSQ